jgi:hypothetical protein
MNTYSWIMEVMIERAGLAIRKAEFLSSTIAIYLCQQVEDLVGRGAL